MDDLDVYDDPDLREALHAAVSGGPEAPSLDRLLADAHRARRGRTVRRAAGGLAAAAAVAGIALAGVQVLAGDSDDRTGQVAHDPPTTEVREAVELGVHVTADGRLVAGTGTTILRTVEDPLARRPEGRSWGVAVRLAGGTEEWGVVDWSPKGTMSSVQLAGQGFAAFEDWVDYEVAASTGSVEPHPVYFAPDGTLHATGPTRIVAAQTGVDLGPAPAGTFTAAAEITVRGDRRWLLARLRPGHAPSYVLVDGDRFDDSLARLVHDARRLYGHLFSDLSAGGSR